MNEIIIDGITFIRKETDGEYKIIRTYAAGVFMAKVESTKAELNGVNGVLIDARRIWYWNGACSLSQLAMEGVTDTKTTKIAVPVNRIEVANIIEIIDMTDQAIKILLGIPPWKQ